MWEKLKPAHYSGHESKNGFVAAYPRSGRRYDLSGTVRTAEHVLIVRWSVKTYLAARAIKKGGVYVTSPFFILNALV